MLAAAVIWLAPHDNLDVQLADPITTLLFSALSLYPTLDVVRLALRVLMQAAPRGLELPRERLREELSVALAPAARVTGVHALGA